MSTEIKKENCRNDQNKNNCQIPNWLQWLTIILIVAIFLLMCIQLHYLWKLSDIWQAVKGSK